MLSSLEGTDLRSGGILSQYRGRESEVPHCSGGLLMPVNPNSLLLFTLLSPSQQRRQETINDPCKNDMNALGFFMFSVTRKDTTFLRQDICYYVCAWRRNSAEMLKHQNN